MLVDVCHLSLQMCQTPMSALLKYGTVENFVGAIIDGYHPDAIDFALLSPKAAQALCSAQNKLSSQYNYGLLIYDAYRPTQAVKHFKRWSAQPAIDEYELIRKKLHYPHIDKSEMFSLGYIADDSSHCYGNAVDVVLVDLNTDKLLPMGTDFDFMDKSSRIDAPASEIGEDAYIHRQILLNAMIEHGFEPYEEEFWHFTHGGIAGREVKLPLNIPIECKLKGLNSEISTIA